ncbi:MAG: hypothetical protein IKK09_05270 [Clostridia bacterium]|nr:hypothetical protein [Clostridia bacterium]
MAESFVVSFFVDECSDEEMNTYIGSRFIPYIYELMQEHKNIVFLLPYGYASSESVARTVRVIAESHPEVRAQCWSVCSCSAEGLYEKMFGEKSNLFNRCVLLDNFDEVPLRQGRIVRNKKMVDMSDLSLFYIEKRNGRIYNTMKYAKETDKKYIRMK